MKLYGILMLGMAVMAPSLAQAGDEPVPSIKQERNYIHSGNILYREKRFAEAEVMYRKALEALPSSEAATFNLASSLLRQAGTADPNAGNNPMKDAAAMFQQLAQSAQDVTIAERSFYNLGNIAFNQQNYQQSIDMYKNALRKNPDNDLTRQNLRLAQLKLKEQQQNQDKNQDNKQDQNQDKNQNQNQDQNQDKKQDQNKDQQQNQDQQKEKDKPQQQPQEQTGMSDASAQQILKAMENEEAATRKRVETQKKKEAQARKKRIVNPW